MAPRSLRILHIKVNLFLFRALKRRQYLVFRIEMYFLIMHIRISTAILEEYPTVNPKYLLVTKNIKEMLAESLDSLTFEHLKAVV